MTNPLALAKYRLSHVRDTDLHYRFAASILPKESLERSKACTFYWLKIPLALLTWAVMCFAAVIFYGGTSLLGPLFGFIPSYFPTKNEDMLDYKSYLFYPYKHLPSGKRMWFAPWEALAFLLVLGIMGYAIYYLGFVEPEIGLVAAYALFAIAAFSAIIFLLSKNWTNPLIAIPRANLVAAWNKACPPLVVEHRHQPEEDND